ncbi:unnamed protein product, partial [Discosporangium mesarthrocarpum]
MVGGSSAHRQLHPNSAAAAATAAAAAAATSRAGGGSGGLLGMSNSMLASFASSLSPVPGGGTSRPRSAGGRLSSQLPLPLVLPLPGAGAGATGMAGAADRKASHAEMEQVMLSRSPRSGLVQCGRRSRVRAESSPLNQSSGSTDYRQPHAHAHPTVRRHSGFSDSSSHHRPGFAFSFDAASSEHEIGMIMGQRPSSIRTTTVRFSRGVLKEHLRTLAEGGT